MQPKASRERIAALEAALRALIDQVERSGGVDVKGHPMKNLQALHDAKAVLARTGA